MAAASNGGEDRPAHTGSAVTRPAASASGTRTAGSLAGQPPASRAACHRARARAAGMPGVDELSAIDLGPRYCVTSVPASPPGIRLRRPRRVAWVRTGAGPLALTAAITISDYAISQY